MTSMLKMIGSKKHGPPASNHAEVSKAACDIGFGAVRPLERPSWLEKLPQCQQHNGRNPTHLIQLSGAFTYIVYINIDIFVIYMFA